MKTSHFAAPIYFDCKTVESEGCFPKVQLTAEIVIDSGEIHHINTDEVKRALVNALKDAVFYCDKEVPREK